MLMSKFYKHVSIIFPLQLIIPYKTYFNRIENIHWLETFFCISSYLQKNAVKKPTSFPYGTFYLMFLCCHGNLRSGTR